MFGTHANFCQYTELLFCTECFGKETRPIPWRLVHSLDGKPRRVSRIAAGFIDTVWNLPVVDMSTVSPLQFKRRKSLRHTQELRRDIVKLVTALSAYDETPAVIRLQLGRDHAYLAETAEMLALADVARAVAGEFLAPLNAALGGVRELALRKHINVV